jgi:hypothetical protein
MPRLSSTLSKHADAVEQLYENLQTLKRRLILGPDTIKPDLDELTKSGSKYVALLSSV